jgi:hypothetical protein
MPVVIPKAKGGVLLLIDTFRLWSFKYVPERIDWHTAKHERKMRRNISRYAKPHDDVYRDGRTLNGEDAPILGQDRDFDEGKANAVA